MAEEEGELTGAEEEEAAGEVSEPERGTRQQEGARPVPIVGVGASAGGLEAMQAFFAALPADSGIGFVVVTHTSPGRESMLPDLLGNVTPMPVQMCEDGIRVQPNHVVVAKDSILSIQDAVLRPIRADHSVETSHHPIDHFLRELAEDQGERAICVILSGSGNDGTLGLRAVKAAGGMAMAQDPNTARYPSMPESAIGTGLTDYALGPEDLAAALLEYCRGPYLLLTRDRSGPLVPEGTIHSILVRLRSHRGHDFTHYKTNSISRRIQRRMNVHRIEEPAAYLRYVKQHPQELDLLLQELLISVTRFFRDPEAFQVLAEQAVPELLEGREEDEPVRVWVPGCATGEEAYSVAIVLDEQLRKRDALHQVQVFGTDLDRAAIEVARAGVYPKGIEADVPKDRLQRHFSHEDGSYRIQKRIRDMLVFAEQNVISDPPFTRMDLIVCRNVLIYMDSEAQQAVLRLFHYALRPGGLLFLGSSESATGSEGLFDVVDSQHRIVRRRETGRPDFASFAGVGPDPSGNVKRGFSEDHPAGLPSRHLARVVERLLLDRFAPCSIVVDDRDVVVYLHGRSGAYFQPEQGQPRNHVVEMAREGLRAPLSLALRNARRQGRPVVQNGLRVRTNGGTTVVDLCVRPIEGPGALEGLLLVTVTPAEGTDERVETSAEPSHEQPPEDREALERELRHTRENLQTTIEELESANEELRSSNEELQSTNEELQSSNEELETSREEMQSLNEELNTVNAELKSKVEALARSNDDMSNLLNSMEVATIFLDSDLRVKRYTRKAQDIVRLIESDIGRPLSDLTRSVDYEGLTEDCERVMETLIPAEKEVRGEGGRYYMVRILPYRTSENVVDGIVITLVDVTRAKAAELEATSRGIFESVVQTVRHPLLVLDEDLRVVQANAQFCAVFAVSLEAIEGRPIYDLGQGEWNMPELRKLLEELLPNRTVMTDHRVELAFPRIGRRAFLLNARQLKRGEEEEQMILLAFEEVD